MKSSKIAIYHGNEEWVLKGIGQDLAAAFRSLGYSVNTTDKVFKKVPNVFCCIYRSPTSSYTITSIMGR